MTTQTDSRVRVDKWLWAARFFKTRALASAAVEGGKVHINGARAKASRALQCGDQLRIQKGPYSFIIEVLALSTHRGPAAHAQSLYRETEASQTARENLKDERRIQAISAPQPGGRPDKRARRQWHKLNRPE